MNDDRNERSGELVFTSFPAVTLELPAWVEELDLDREYPTQEERMRLVVELSRLNVERGTGGPFGAAVFDLSTNRLVAPGMNLVVPSSCSVAHAEMVAIMIAQQVVGDFDLGGDGKPAYELLASTEPCAMCFGATPWSGVRRLVCGARDEDARAVGFDEGAKLSEWALALEERGIAVERDVLREEAAAVLRHYAESGGRIYNARQGD
jgi:tRNA(Arg) A34 adenosine deaminase TadA